MFTRVCFRATYFFALNGWILAHVFVFLSCCGWVVNATWKHYSRTATCFNIIMMRRKALLLGVSHPCVLKEVERRGISAEELRKQPRSVEAVADLVKQCILSEMDGRDLARCVATENVCMMDVYTVSQEKGALYRDDRHLYANFNRPLFVKSLKRAFADVIFDQIILDYFWIPSGWDEYHWKSSFFRTVLPGFVEGGVLAQDGAIYLPFCLHCFKEVLAAKEILLKYFNISFLLKNDLHRNSLWKGTQDIEARVMQNVFGKRIDQEEKYCTFRREDIASSLQGTSIRTSVVLDVSFRIEKFHEVRFIELKRIPEGSPKGDVLGLLPKVSSLPTPSTPSREKKNIAVVTPTVSEKRSQQIRPASSERTRQSPRRKLFDEAGHRKRVKAA